MSEQFAPNPAALGYAAYTPLTLRLYDLFALGFCNRFIWRCEVSGAIGPLPLQCF